ncbi:hypothetical protein N0V83_003337 [Neocucurbitaria cava]|uniref:Hemerythrin-like domain-containing protein n=1 Tax=Neocucurbitaria cava TaxID=798079 RepID=A0A9W8YC23_9PLEO|nr:hypothetical protein N0V83_003337 [Neocucurbitaria cava]
MAKPWADTPFSLLLIPGTPGAPTVSILNVCIEMANVHNILLRSLNSIYLQCPHISTTNNSTDDVADLMTYITAWTDAVHHHHSLEETLFFPCVEELAKEVGLESGLMGRNVEQHHLFEDGVREMGVYARDVLEGRKGFDSGVLRGW